MPRYYAALADEPAGALLRQLAQRLASRHGDQWLADVLNTPHTANTAQAFALLGKAIAEGEDWHYVAAGKEAEKALPLFASAGSQAGALFARLEQVYALDWDEKKQACVAAAEAVRPELGKRHYVWADIQALLEEGSCATWTVDLERAGKIEDEASGMASESGYSVLALRAAGMNASRHAQIGNTAAAWRENFAGLKSYWDGRYPPLRAYQFYSALSLLADQGHNSYSAMAWAQEAASIASGHAMYAPALWQLGLAEFSAGAAGQAHLSLERSMELEPSLREDTMAVIEMAALETSHGQAAQAMDHLESVRRKADESHGLVRLRFAAELGRAHLARTEYADAGQWFRGALEIGENGWTRAADADRLLWTHTMESIYRGLLECQIRTRADPLESRKLWSQYRTHLFGEGREKSGAEPALPPGAARLSFVELSGAVAAWLETDHGVQFQEIARPDEVTEAAERLARGCASGQSREELLREDGAELSRKLLGAWDGQLDGVGTVVVEADRPVAAVPWSALVRRNGHYWAADFSLRVRAGVGSGVESRTPLARIERVLAVGAPAISGEDGLAALPHSREEAEKVSAMFPRSIPLTGKSATWSEVRQRLGEAELFHFSGHGYGGEGGGLLLRGPEGRLALLRAADIRSLNLSRCRLVVLGGCSTAAGERSGPGDPQSLVRAFLRAGAQDVVAGLWNLDSGGTQMLMQKFYDAMLSGEPVPESLRRAEASVRGVYSHPYYWAGLEVFSNN